MQPAAWPPMMRSGPGAGVSAPAATVSATASSAAMRQRSEPALEDGDDVAWLDEGLPAGFALNGLALD